MGSYVERLAAVKVLEAGLEENAVGLDNADHLGYVVQHGFLFGVSKSGSGLGALNDLSGVGLIGEDSIDLVAEGVVVNEVGGASFVLGNE